MTANFTLGEIYKEACETLSAAGIDNARLDARVLLGAVIDGGEAAIFGYPEREVSVSDARRIRDLVSQRATRVPLSQVLGHKEFWSLDFEVTADTLTPRPDTETLIEAVVDAVGKRRDEALRILDLGTGSGCILLTLLHALPKASGLGIDRSEEALRVARRNAKKMGLEERAVFIEGDWVKGVSEKFDFIVSNPPYIPSGDIGGLAPEVARFEPILALDGGLDGLEAYRIIAAAARERLLPDGEIFLEVGAGQAQRVAEMLKEGGLEEVDVFVDLAGLDRCVSGCRKTGPKEEKRTN